MKALVTGATGFVGSHTAAALTAAGHEVRALVRNPARIPGSLGALGVEAEIVVGAVTDGRGVGRAVAG